jgi:hypothetical protein
VSSDPEEEPEVDVFTKYTNKAGILVDERQLEQENAYMP